LVGHEALDRRGCDIAKTEDCCFHELSLRGGVGLLIRPDYV
jgi:hypothetical protein